MRKFRILVGASAVMNMILCASCLYLRNMSLRLINKDIEQLQNVLKDGTNYDSLSGIKLMTEGTAELILILSYSGLLISVAALTYVYKAGKIESPHRSNQ